MDAPRPLLGDGRLQRRLYGLRNVLLNYRVEVVLNNTTRTDALMGPAFHDAPAVADLNTLAHAYCG